MTPIGAPSGFGDESQLSPFVTADPIPDCILRRDEQGYMRGAGLQILNGEFQVGQTVLTFPTEALPDPNTFLKHSADGSLEWAPAAAISGSVEWSQIINTPSTLVGYGIAPSSIDHGQISGLADDDHTQYYRTDGTRVMTGNANWGGFNLSTVGILSVTSISISGVLTSTLVTGTAPFTVASTTRVTNLNVDQLDDQHGAYYLDSANFTGTDWTDLTDGGATTLHKHDHGGLDGLADDDHTQYYRADGTRVMIGNADWGGFNLANVGVLTATEATVGGGAAQSSAFISARGGKNAFEWGHSNTAGFGSTLGFRSSSGQPFIAFSGEAGTNINTIRTRGIRASIIRSNLSGGWIFENVPLAVADNQTPVAQVTISNAGAVSMGALTLSGALDMGTNNITNVGAYSGGAITASGLLTATDALLKAAFPVDVEMWTTDATVDNKRWRLRSSPIAWGDFAIQKLTDAGALTRNHLLLNPDGSSVFAGAVSMGALTAGGAIHFDSASAGVQVGVAPTGGDKGAGTINVATDIYKNNSAYTNPDYVFELAHDSNARKVPYGYRIRNLEEIEAYTRAWYHLPGTHPSNPMGMFDRSDWLLEKVEETFLHLIAHHYVLSDFERRFKNHDSRIARLEDENKELRELVTNLRN